MAGKELARRMKKNIVVLASSPRKHGNSNALCDQFMLGAIESGHRAVKVSLAEKKIGYCKGCNGCQDSGRCVQKDDMPQLLDQMIAADVIVLATPVYFYSMSAQLKTAIDRTYPCYTKLAKKEFYFILTAADGKKSSMQRAVESLRGFTSCLPGAVEKGIVYGTGAWQQGDIQGSRAMKQAYDFGKAV